MDLTSYRKSEAEIRRTSDLLRLMPSGGANALDVGARDGHFSVLMAERFDSVTALDLALPDIRHPRVTCVAGRAEALSFDDASFDLVFCAEVLEHIPTPMLRTACSELRRVTRKHLLVGVPYRQDRRVGRTTCSNCGNTNPAWGHVNEFDESYLNELFGGLHTQGMSLVPADFGRTNGLSAILMDLAGNPFGTYGQEESCVHCGRALEAPPPQTVTTRVLRRLAVLTEKAVAPFVDSDSHWIHLLFTKVP